MLGEQRSGRQGEDRKDRKSRGKASKDWGSKASRWLEMWCENDGDIHSPPRKTCGKLRTEVISVQRDYHWKE